MLSGDDRVQPTSLAIDMDEEINLLDYLAVIVKRRRLIICLCAVAVITAAIVSLTLPNIYSATATIIPPKTRGGMLSLASKLGGLAGLAGGMLGGGNSGYEDMLKSHTVTDAIITRFNLRQVYNVKLITAARATLQSKLSVKSSKAGFINIVVEDKNPQQAADIANAYVEELVKLNRKLQVSDATRQRVFLEKRLEETKERLVKAESQLRKFQEKNKIISLDRQAGTAMGAAAGIKGQIIATETELKVLEGFVSGNENQVIRLKQKLAELKEQLAKIEDAEWPGSNPGKLEHSNPARDKDESNFYLILTRIPGLRLQLGRLTREVSVQGKVFGLLTEQYEMAKIAEAGSAATIQVLDKAMVPERKAKPRRERIVVLTGMVSFFVSIFLAFVLEFFERVKTEDKERWEEIKAGLGKA